MSSRISAIEALSHGLVSGLYQRQEVGFGPGRGYAATLMPEVVETVRLDVDGWYPQMMVSGSFSTGPASFKTGYVEWAADDLIAHPTSPYVWEGYMRGTWGDTGLLPHQQVKVEIPGGGRLSWIPATLIITFFGGAPTVSRRVTYVSPFFRTAQMVWDSVEGATRVTSYNTGSHPNRPATLPIQNLTMAEVFSRAGVDLQTSTAERVVPLSLSGADDKWSDSELEGVLKQYWSRYKSQAQWSMWLLFAGLHEDPDTRGKMFDHFGAFKRRGGAAFNDWWLDYYGASEPYRDAQIHRRRFVTACHETGHCFDLIHSDEPAASNWWPLGNEPLAMSFMNNPESLGGNGSNFFENFEYRFSDRELKFIRHAPEKFVEMGGPYYGDDYSDALPPAAFPDWTLDVSVSKSQRMFDFLEPVIVELKLTNSSDRPQVIDENILRTGEDVVVAVRRSGGVTTKLRPYVISCLGPKWRVLQPGESIRHSVFASAGTMGWLISEPGTYEVRASLKTSAVNAFAPPLGLRVALPGNREEELLAQEFFTEDVGRTLALGGTTVMQQANAVLERMADQMSDRPMARHAQLALGLPKLRGQKTLRLPEGQAPLCSAAADGGAIAVTKAYPDDGRRLIRAALSPGSGCETFPAEFLERLTRRFEDLLEQASVNR